MLHRPHETILLNASHKLNHLLHVGLVVPRLNIKSDGCLGGRLVSFRCLFGDMGLRGRLSASLRFGLRFRIVFIIAEEINFVIVVICRLLGSLRA